jgi:hypothetical protein
VRGDGEESSVSQKRGGYVWEVRQEGCEGEKRHAPVNFTIDLTRQHPQWAQQDGVHHGHNP